MDKLNLSFGLYVSGTLRDFSLTIVSQACKYEKNIELRDLEEIV